MPVPKLQIAAPEKALSPCSPGPHLMPFHIAYSGPAPIATFFRVREEEDKKVPIGPSSASSPNASRLKDTDAAVNTAAEQPAKSRLVNRFIAAFRGRRVVGLGVPLPAGYVGIVLRSDAPGGTPGKTKLESKKENETTGKAKVAAKGTRRSSVRRTRRSKAVDVEDEQDVQKNEEVSMDLMDLDEVDPSIALTAGASAGEVRMLKPIQTFTSLMVWNPDIVVDEGRDEYIRTLREWTSLAAEMHRVED